MFELRGDVVDYRCMRGDRCQAERHVRRPGAIWILVAATLAGLSVG